MNEQKLKVSDLNLPMVLQLIWDKKYAVLLLIALSMLVSVLIVIKMPNQYASLVKVSIAEQDKTTSLASMVGGLGGLASMAGLDIGGKSDKGFYYSELIMSKSFILPFIKKYNLGPEIIAGIGWDQTNDEIILNDEIYDKNKGVWVREVSYPFSNPPADFELYEAFREIVSFEYDKKTSFITIRAKYYSPNFTKKVLDNLIADFNELQRKNDVEEANKSISYLQNQINLSTVTELNQLSYKLITENMKTLMLANIRGEYALETIEPAAVIERKVGPKRAMMCIILTFLGGLVALIYPFMGLIINDIKNKIKIVN